MTRRILGIDPGLATLGFGAIACETKTQRMTVLDFGVVRTPPKTAIGDRLCILYDDLHELIRLVRPDLVAVEKLFFYRMGNTIAVAQARGVLLLAIAQNKLPIVEFTPAQVKQAIAGYGNADKQEVQAAVARELNLDAVPKPDDAADALAIAIAAWFQTSSS